MKRQIVWVLVFILLCTACGTKEAAIEPQALSLVLGHHANFPVLPQTVYDDAVYEAFYSYGQVSVVIADGSPHLAAQYANERPAKSIDHAKRQQLARSATDTVLPQLAALEAETGEIDTLGAIHVAVNALRGSGLTEQTLVIADSGLSTAGLLDFTAENLLEADPDLVAEALQDRNALPDLRGISVWVLGLGQTCGSQIRPDAETQARLTALWTAVLQEGEPKSLTVDPTPLPGQAPAETLPFCTPVPLVTERLVLDTPEGNPIGTDPIRLSSIRFRSDESEFLDRTAALEALTPIGAYLAAHPETAVCLAGMTASAGGTGETLSLARAQACRDLLLELGASETQILCLGLGRSDNFLRVPDLDADGQLIESEAEKNRAVFLFSRESETMMRLQAGE